LFSNATGLATTHVFVKAHNFGVTFNGVTAAAAIPEVLSKGASLITSYHIPSASSYDWSSYPTAFLSSSGATWDEALISGDTVGWVASGINHIAQANDDSTTFIAGALLGLAGGAILSAVQEALHADD
jgi:hypothetical protein